MSFVEGTAQDIIDLDIIATNYRKEIDKWLENCDTSEWEEDDFAEMRYSYIYMKRTLDKFWEQFGE